MTTEHDVTNELHRAECAACRQLWSELDAISAEAARLPPLSPSRDLWAGIEPRLGQVSAVAQSSPAIREPRRWFAAPSFRLAMAASLLVAVTSAVTWRIATSSGDTEAPLAALPHTKPVESLEHFAAFTASVSEMDREIAALQTIVAGRRGELDAATVAILESSLKLIDRAISESRAALAADPASQFLAAQFARAYTGKLTLLRDVATLPVGT